MTSRAFTTRTGSHSSSFTSSFLLTISVFPLSSWLLLLVVVFCFLFLFGGGLLSSSLFEWRVYFFYHYIYIIKKYFFLFLHSTHIQPYFPHFFSLSYIYPISLSFSHSLSLHLPLPPWPQGRTADRLCTPAAQGLFLRSICPSLSLWRLTQPNNISSVHIHICTQTHTGINTCTH